jgi:hypothetical protein
LPAGYHYEACTSQTVPELITALEVWYPGITTGNASCYLRPEFYAHKVCGDDVRQIDNAVILFRRGGELAGMFAAERDLDSQVLYARLGVVAPAHRGAHLSRNFLSLPEAMGRAMGLGMTYGLATLRYPQMQASFERMGWKLIGITPGFDREMVEPGVVRRVYEAVYCKVLADENEFLLPHAKDLTPAVRALFDLLYPGRCAER